MPYRKLLVCLLLTGIAVMSCSEKQQFTGKFRYDSENPQPGDEITIYYNPDSTDLAGAEEINCVAYLYNADLISAKDIKLYDEDGLLKGKVKTADDAYGVILKFVADDIEDSNNKNGYVIHLKDNEGNNIAGTIAGLAAAYNRWGAYYAGLDRDRDKAYILFQKEFKSHPELKKDFLLPYFEVVYAVKTGERSKIIKAELEKIENKKNCSVKDYELLADWYSKIGYGDKAKKYSDVLFTDFPESDYVQREKYLEFRKIKDVNEKLSFLEKYENQYPEGEYLRIMYDLTANAYRDAKDFEGAFNFLKNNSEKVSTYRFYYVVKRMIDNNAEFDLAENIAALGIKRNEEEVENPLEEKPNYLSDREWLKEREYYFGLNLYGYGMALYHNNKVSKSIPVLERAVELTRKNEGDINELYSKALVESGNYSTALSSISGFIKSGSSTSKMKNLLKEAYLNEYGSDEGFEKFASQFEEAAKEQLIAKLKKEIILEPAPDFTLDDLNGNTVSLSSLKGKTVIVDFWATWCGPCLASFPGMKKAVEKYSDDENVKFLFVNSWERVENKLENAKDFIAKNDYPFRVLIDEENKVIEKFKVSGIPTKFIIDGEGNIRFKSIGYQGTEDQLVEELSVMISMIN